MRACTNVSSARIGLAAVFVVSLAGVARAQPVVFTVDPARSSMEVTIELQTIAGNRTDSDSASITGYVYGGADSYTAPGTVVLYDFELLLSEDLDFTWSYGFAGSAHATLSGGGLIDAAPGTPKGPAPVTGGQFNVLGVPTQAVGIADTDYSIILVGSGQSTVDLSTQGAQDGTLPGTITVMGSTIEVTSTVSFSGTFPIIEGVATAVVNGTGTVVATATRPTCPADISPPAGSLDFFDVSAFLGAYNAHSPSADFNSDGAWNFFDVSAFLGAYNSGCD